MRTILFILALAAFATAQDAPEPETPAPRASTAEKGMFTIRLSRDTELKDVLEMVTEATGEALLYDPNGQRLRGQKVGATIERTVPRARVFDTYRAILAFYELMLVPVGPTGYEVYLVIDSRSTNNFIKNQATPVPLADIEKWSDKTGQYVSCVIPVRNVENLTTLRTALSTMVSPAGIGRVHEVPGSNSIVVMDFAPTVAAITRIVRQLDTDNPGTRRVFTVIDLDHGRAADVAAAVSGLVHKPAPPAAGRSRYTPIRRPAPRIVAYGARNAVAISCREDELADLKSLVAELDRPRADQRIVEVVRMKHVRAAQLTATIARAMSGAAVEVQADERTNSLIISGTRPDQAAVKSLIRLLDVPVSEAPSSAGK